MPTYEYSCSACGTFEVFQRITEEPLESCPSCGGAVKKVISSGAAIIFKGSGFYTTDYKNNGNGSGKKKTESSSNETASKKGDGRSSKSDE